jgi:hypothetical protein
MQLTCKQTLVLQLQKLWDNGYLLRECLNDSSLFPKQLRFKTPTSYEVSNNFAQVKQWISTITHIPGIRIVSKTIRHKTLGSNLIPQQAWVDDLDSAVSLINKKSQLVTFKEVIKYVTQHQPQLLAWVEQYPLKALELAAIFPKLISVVKWRQANSHPNIYLRQISLPEIDSKFIEQHRATLAGLFDLILAPNEINSELTGIKHFPRRYGFCDKPQYLRFRILDQNLQLLPGIDAELTLTANDSQALLQQVDFMQQLDTVFIVENEINFLAFPKHSRSIVIFGAGYGFAALQQVAWLKDKQIFYWGDIDSHGFAILNQLRHSLPHAKSLLMDIDTLLEHRDFWVKDVSAEHKELQNLNAAEQQLYQDLLSNKYALQVRLEQERINYEWCQSCINKIHEFA